MTILSKKQLGSNNNPIQSSDSTTSSTTSTSITLQPINESLSKVESDENIDAKNTGIKSPLQTIQIISPIKTDLVEISTNTSQVSSSSKSKTKKSNKRKIKSANMPISSANFMNINQNNLANILSSSSGSSSMSSNGSYSFSYQKDLDQTEYYRLSDDSDYDELDDETRFFSKNNNTNNNECKKSKETSSKNSKKLNKLSSKHLGTTNKSKRNNNEIKSSENVNIGTNNDNNNNSEDEYDQTPTIFINNSQDDTFIKSAKTIEELEQNFGRALKEKKGFIIKSMKEDGACLFRAVADQIYGDQEMHSTIRCHCMDYIAKNADYFKQYITEDIERYLARKRQDNCFGNHIEIIAIAEIYNRPIEVYEYSLEPKNTFQSEFQTDNEPIRLSYHGRMHYNSVVNPSKATIGVGLGLPQLIPGLAEKNLLNEALKKSEEFQIEQAMLDDKLKASDWEATNEELMDLVARESYLQWLKDNEKRENVNFLQATTAASCSSWSNELIGKEKSKTSPSSKSSPTSSSKTSSKISSAASSNLNKEFEDIGLFSLTNQTPTHPNSLQDDDDDDILARVLAESQQDYLDSLKIKYKQQQGHQF